MTRDDETPVQPVAPGEPQSGLVDEPDADGPVTGRDPDASGRGRAPGERFQAWAKGLALLLPALGGLVVGIIGVWKGGDAQHGVDQTYEKMRAAVNEQGKALRRLHIRFVAFQARQEGETAASLHGKLQALQRRYDAAQAALKAKERPNGRQAKLDQLRKDLELEKIKRARLEERLKAKIKATAAGRGAPTPQIRQLPKSWRKAE